MLNVVLIQTQNYCGRGPEYVSRLRRQLRANLTVPYRVYVITDDVAANYPRALVKPARYRGWWEKLRIFQPGMFREGRVLFLDLDTIVVGNIDHVVAYDGPLAMLHDFWRPKGLGPAVMLFDPERCAWIWEEWRAAGFPMDDPRGDQWWLESLRGGLMRQNVDILQEMFPGEFHSYKTTCTQGIPEGARVVCFHGRPRPHEAGGWVKDYWTEAVAHG